MPVIHRSPWKDAQGATSAVSRWNAKAHPSLDPDLDSEEASVNARVAALVARRRNASPETARSIIARLAALQTRLANLREERAARNRSRATSEPHPAQRDATPPAPRIPDLPRSIRQ